MNRNSKHTNPETTSPKGTESRHSHPSVNFDNPPSDRHDEGYSDTPEATPSFWKGMARGAVKGGIIAIIALLGMLLFSGCGNDDYNELPRQIQTFLNTYYPGEGVANFNESDGTYTVNLDRSATIIFNPDLIWISIDGNGETIPTQFLYDKLPSPLYAYIVSSDNLNEVYSVSWNAGIYQVKFLNNAITYDTVTEEISPLILPEE